MSTMAPHPDFAGTDWPRNLDLKPYRLTPLGPAQVNEDFAAVMAAAPILGDFFGDWPEGLTLEENLIDLAWHEREFTTKRSFSWIIRDAENVYIGCFYISPKPGMRGQANADLWLCDIPDRVVVARRIKAALDIWMAKHLPKDLAVNWTTSPALE